MRRARLQVIGIGSPAGDDRLGWEVIEQLRKAGVARPQLRLLSLDRPGTALIDELDNATTTWLVDALLDPGHIGQRRQPSLNELAASIPVTAHGFGLAQSLQLAQTLNRLPNELQIHTLSIGVADPLSSELSPAVARGVDELSLWLTTQIQTLFELHAH